MIYDEKTVELVMQLTDVENKLQKNYEKFLMQLEEIEQALDDEPGDTITLSKDIVRKAIRQDIAFAALLQQDYDRVKEYFALV